MIFYKLVTATIAIINFVLSILPGHPTYYQLTSCILGKMYSTTMMVVLNSRIVFQTQEESPMSNENLLPTTSNPKFSRKPACDGISITREQWTAPVDGFKAHVSTCYSSFLLPLILILLYPMFVLVTGLSRTRHGLR